LVTGGSQGIGRAIAFGLAAEGVRVAICARDKARLEQTAGEIKIRTNAEVFVVPGDLSRLDEVNRVATTVRERFGRLDILVNNAGAIRGGDFMKIPDEQWAGDWSLKILGYVRMARAVFPIMQAQGGGRIGTPEDIADLVCFLVSARASFITGVCITVDGGATRGVYL